MKQKQESKKHNRLFYLVKNKLDCVKMLVSKSVIDGIIDHKELAAIMKEKKDYDCQKSESGIKKMNEIETV